MALPVPANGFSVAVSGGGRRVLMLFSQRESCLVGMEACDGAHYRARDLTAVGHQVRLMRTR